MSPSYLYLPYRNGTFIGIRDVEKNVSSLAFLGYALIPVGGLMDSSEIKALSDAIEQRQQNLDKNTIEILFLLGKGLVALSTNPTVLKIVDSALESAKNTEKRAQERHELIVAKEKAEIAHEQEAHALKMAREKAR
jgi:hypothetical protein